jgi:hypothetical protein
VKVELKENLCPIWQVPWRSIGMRPESPLLLFQGGKCASNGCLGLDSCRIFLATMFETRYDSFYSKRLGPLLSHRHLRFAEGQRAIIHISFENL